MLLNNAAVIRTISVAALTVLAAVAQAQPAQVRDIPSRPVPETEDELNRFTAANTVDGLVITVTIDGPNISLDQATPARIPNKPRLQIKGEGDLAPVTAVGLASGARVSQATVPDSVLRALDDWGGKGETVRVTRRQVTIPLSAPSALDSVEVSAPATGARATLDVRSAYAELCRASRGSSNYCPGQPPR